MDRQYYRSRPVAGPQGNGANSGPGEKRRCDACGNVTQCILFPTKAGRNTGALCLMCLSRSFRSMRDEPNW